MEKAIKKLKAHARLRRMHSAATSVSVGLGSCVAISGNFYNSRLNKIIHTSDADALRNDWKMVGDDMSKAIEKLKQIG
jgi:hypothetical protein